MKDRTPKRAFKSLKAYRKALKLNQREAAAKVGVSQSCWARAEAGQNIPHKARLKRILKETGVPLDVLMGIAS